MAVERDFLKAPKGCRSGEVASFLAQLDTLTRYLRRDLRGIGARELAWQPARGMNTIGMLLAHLAIVEVFWTEVGLKAVKFRGTRPALGIGEYDDGLPLRAGGPPPRNLARRRLAYFTRLMARGRAHVKRTARRLADRDLARRVSRTRRDGRRQEFDRRWVLFHLVEHFAGHYGQILLLRHMYRDARRRRG